MPRLALEIPVPASARNADFVNRARRFVKQTPLLPGMPVFLAAAAAATILMTAAGAFGTAGMPLVTRLLFWTMLIGVNTVLWTAWLAWRVRSHRDWWPAVGLGIVILNLFIPVEINLALSIVGSGVAHGWPLLWARSLAISAGLLLVVAAVLRRQKPARIDRFAKGRLWREGFRDPNEIAAISAEDHYCRVARRDGSNSLIHARFRDLADEVAGLDGAVVRRGRWVAAAAVERIDRDGRRWRLALAGDRSLLVSPSAVAELRERGWIG
jgi:hypothetical protein